MIHTGLGANDGKNSSNDLFDHGLILDKSELIPQRLSAKPKGNSIKYAKQGPRKFMPLEYSEVTLENIKRACKVYYWGNLTTRDILASEQGSSFSRLNQIPSFKVTYVLFIIPEPGKPIPSETLELDPFQSQPQHKNMRRNVILHSAVSAVSTAKSIVSSVVPKSLSTVDMLKFGKNIKLVEKKILNVVVEEF